RHRSAVLPGAASQSPPLQPCLAPLHLHLHTGPVASAQAVEGVMTTPHDHRNDALPTRLPDGTAYRNEMHVHPRKRAATAFGAGSERYDHARFGVVPARVSTISGAPVATVDPAPGQVVRSVPPAGVAQESLRCPKIGVPFSPNNPRVQFDQVGFHWQSGPSTSGNVAYCSGHSRLGRSGNG